MKVVESMHKKDWWRMSAYAAGIALNLVFFFFMHIHHFGVDDFGIGELSGIPLTVGFAEQALEQDVPV